MIYNTKTLNAGIIFILAGTNDKFSAKLASIFFDIAYFLYFQFNNKIDPPSDVNVQ